MYSKLQYISQGKTAGKQLANIQNALEGGCKWIQLRFKECEMVQLLPVAEKVRELCSFYGAVFIVNDHVDIAFKSNADGVHLGLEDVSVKAAREVLGPQKIIGGTANTLEDVLKRVDEKCNYIGLGPFRFTTTKKKLSPVLGASGYMHIMSELKKRNIFVPVYAIGGIVFEDIEAITYTGVHGIAVSGLITTHPDKKQLIQQIHNGLYATT
ncbi:MAG TPA: thiamine phosphate synthase [Flavobacteriales bacterium]|nr:thiamine phosphate synthase [Flavobacteriales bacterium]